MEEPELFRRDVSAFLATLRHSIDRTYRISRSDEDREGFTRIMLIIEEARIRFGTYARQRRKPTVDEWAAARRELASFAVKFLEATEGSPRSYDQPLSFTMLMSRDRENPTPFISRLLEASDRDLLISEAMFLFQEYLETSDAILTETQGSLSFESLDRIVPRQQVAPVQFGVHGGRIVVVDRPPRADKEDRLNIKSAFEHIRDSGDKLIDNLTNSNCDKRLLDSVRELQSQLVANGNIVKIGLANLACGIMGTQFQSELPDAVMAMFNSYNASISLYVAQFPEWDQFTQKAAATDLDEADVADVKATATQLIEELKKNAALADPEVPRTIALIQDFLSSPGVSSKRAAFAMIRTIENLVSSILHYSLSFVGKTAERTLDTGPKVVATIAVGLLSIALLSATGIGSAASRAGAPWVKQAAEVIQKQIGKALE